jgi:hypothetical protein
VTNSGPRKEAEQGYAALDKNLGCYINRGRMAFDEIVMFTKG